MPKGNSSSSHASKPTKSCSSKAPFLHREEEEDGDGVMENSILMIYKKTVVYFYVVCCYVIIIIIIVIMLLPIFRVFVSSVKTTGLGLRAIEKKL